jgi:DNA-binding CsgD family transcriptional regulator
MIAEVCKLLGSQVGSVMPTACNDPKLSPRERETLQHLLSGDSEKQVAAKLQLSRHTVHIYVKTLYKHFGVNSRGELLAKCLGGSPMQ